MDVKNKNEEENMEGQGADLDNADDNWEEDEDDDDYVTGNKNYYEMEYDHYDWSGGQEPIIKNYLQKVNGFLHYNF